ncbi:MAG: hypothetical protein A2268_02125 [Candidatus Raymondbacteria bacterium RifOxyA12_full_50_37]|uniref:DUF354 domain-containing protein n=1 Tax=Candidatus Raymondbacteria bacterium RIFOXYD12_FULL_49_13 TaxID=1817890 RepID=A0A1F7F4J8_UNCRA|nr:MAG: hypothetical protein A2268_02125 [Candidatus Raymondbacteria bacterium RifOxyA12_full_50_37]OGJ91294.1 MAG: hypothetical protein A2350_13210 [Candidatus Raymondbacteria bacterium RifOxyB12_full_50_8]OGJ92225.1 MAG: hypothetical protein A2248_10955 [Candidatus Raymondbacteria bacterium RIFOXYA2_FULL_49_16]OGJ98551.1 MAG: hypothetical protein A2453_06755 [Candidatus Raymondbacteria bacterium RIFOXYC2_FULL_50_21]OGK01590.1 MAG: hypothetical protein A2519_05975 [Candidatus Raymondbacteria b
MNIVISIEHPAWAHQFQGIIKQLRQDGHRVLVLAVRKEMDLTLLEYYGIAFTLIARSTGRNIVQKAWLLLYTSIRYFLCARKFRADLFIGRASPMMAIASRLLGKPHILFEDTDHAVVGLFFCRLFSASILTTKTFKKNMGKNHRRVNTFKELFYLHPDHFTPDPASLGLVGLKQGDLFFIVRFVAWEADHDLGHKGLSIETKRTVVEELGKLGRVFISSEKELPSEFEAYRMLLPPEKIHDLIYYATLLYGESATMAAEAAVLGTHSIFCYFTGLGSITELENAYQLVYNFRLSSASQRKSVSMATALASEPDIWTLGKEKRKHLLAEKGNGMSMFLKEIRRFSGV